MLQSFSDHNKVLIPIKISKIIIDLVIFTLKKNLLNG